MELTHVVCPRCMEHAVPKGGTECELCGWKKKGTANVASKPLEATPVVDHKDDDVIDKPEPAAEKTKKATNKKTAECLKCGEEKVIISRGLCQRCRYQEDKAGTLDKNYPVLVGKAAKDAKEKAAAVRSEQADEVSGGGGMDKTASPSPSPVACEQEKKTDNSIGKININFFAEDSHLLDEIRRRAKKNRRHVTAEALCLLEKALEVA